MGRMPTDITTLSTVVFRALVEKNKPVSAVALAKELNKEPAHVEKALAYLLQINFAVVTNSDTQEDATDPLYTTAVLDFVAGLEGIGL